MLLFRVKWCGYNDDPQPVTERLRDFAEQNWKNKAFRQMTFGLYCPPMAFCEQAKVRNPPAPAFATFVLSRGPSRATYLRVGTCSQVSHVWVRAFYGVLVFEHLNVCRSVSAFDEVNGLPCYPAFDGKHGRCRENSHWPALLVLAARSCVCRLKGRRAAFTNGDTGKFFTKRTAGRPVPGLSFRLFSCDLAAQH